MKKFLIFVSFIFLFLSCCLTSLEFKSPDIKTFAVQQQITSVCPSVEKKDITSDYYIACSSHLNLSQYLANLFGNFCAVCENNTYKKLNLNLVFTHWEIISSSNLKISTVLNPRAP